MSNKNVKGKENIIREIISHQSIQTLLFVELIEEVLNEKSKNQNVKIKLTEDDIIKQESPIKLLKELYDKTINTETTPETKTETENIKSEPTKTKTETENIKSEPTKNKLTPKPKKETEKKQLYSIATYDNPNDIKFHVISHNCKEARKIGRDLFKENLSENVSFFKIKSTWKHSFTQENLKDLPLGEITDNIWLLKNGLIEEVEDETCPRCKEEMINLKYNTLTKEYYCSECKGFEYCPKCGKYRMMADGCEHCEADNENVMFD